MPIVVGGIPNPIPFAPDLVSPANAAYADLSGTPEFEWTFLAGTIGNVQSTWAFRRKIAGASSYQYWNATTSAWQSTVIYNTGTDQSVTFPSGAWTDGNTYNWSVATQDVAGTGPFAADDTLTAQAPPTLTIISPAGVTTVAQPVVQWAPSVPSGSSQTGFEVIVYNAAQYGEIGFTPGVGENVYDSGVVGSAFLAQLQLPVPLSDFTSYRVYVQITETGGQTSAWVESSFTTSYAQPATPTLVAVAATDPDSDSPQVVLGIEGRDNLLSAADALTQPGPGTLGTWVATEGTASNDSGYLNLTGSTSRAIMGGITAEAGYDYAFGVTALTSGGGTVGSYTPFIEFLNSGGTVLATVDAPTVALGTVSDGGTATAPAGSVTAKIGVLVTAGTSGVATISNAAIGPSGGVGMYGGFAGLGFATIQYSDDNGQTWWDVRNGVDIPLPLPLQGALVVDTEAPPGFTRQYQCTVFANNALSGVGTAECNVTPSLLWWFKDPLNPAANMPVSLQPGTLDTVSTDRQQLYQVLGRPDDVILSDAFELPQITFTLIFITDASYQAFEALRATQHVFLLQGPAPAGQWYVRCGPTKNDSTNLPSLRGFAANGKIVRTVQLTLQAVAAP